MKYSFNLYMLILFLFSNIMCSQHFKLTDTACNKNDVLVRYDVLFDIGKYTIRQDSKPFFDSVFNFLETNKQVEIEIGFHTDERGSKAFSVCLTCRRAKSVRNYLIAKGIDPKRLVAKGYSGDKPIIKGAKTDFEHQKNRRLELKISIS